MLEEEMKTTNKAVEYTTKEPVTDSDKNTIGLTKQNDISKDSIEKKVESKKQASTIYENKHINEWTSKDVIRWCRTYNLLILAQLLEHYDGASLLRLRNI